MIRRYPVYHELDGWRLASLPARVARDLGYAVPEEKEQVLVWHGPARSYKTISLHEVLTDFERSIPQRRMDEFRDKIVIIGTTAPGLHDSTARHRIRAQRKSGARRRLVVVGDGTARRGRLGRSCVYAHFSARHRRSRVQLALFPAGGGARLLA